MKKKVVIAMSGGVDSSVVAVLMKQAGYDCVGMHLRFWSDKSVCEIDSSAGAAGGAAEGAGAKLPQNKCCTTASLEDARKIAADLDMPFYVMNVEESFKEKVVDNFLDSYAAGQTPNPCVQCNRHIKFGALLQRAKELGDYLATGHYIKLEEEGGKMVLRAAKDSAKDQSYFLYHLNQEKLKNVKFPLGNLLKSEVYELARANGLIRVSEKKESQGICFFAESTPQNFLMRHLDTALFSSGDIVTVDGKKVGRHRGLPLYTIGQRSGLGIGGVAGEQEGRPWYVIAMDREHNQLVVGHEEDVSQCSFSCSSVSFVSSEIPREPLEISVRIRHRGEFIPALLTMEGQKAFILCHKPVWAVSPGQSAVFYRMDEVVGGGIIEEKSLNLRYEKETTRDLGRGVSVAH